MSIQLTLAQADTQNAGDLPGRIQYLDWPSPRVVGVLSNTPWPIGSVHPARRMREVACDFLREVARDAPPGEVLAKLAEALDGEMASVVGEADIDAAWDFGGHLGLTATDGRSIAIARAGHIRIAALGEHAEVLRTENTLGTTLRSGGHPVVDPNFENIITAFVGRAHLPSDLVGIIDDPSLRRLFLCSHGATRDLELNAFSTLGGASDPVAAAHELLHASLRRTSPQSGTHRTQCVAVIDVSRATD